MALTKGNLYDYSDFKDIFPAVSSDKAFQSYLYSTSDISTLGNTNVAHNTAKGQITYADKYYQGVPLTKYDEITRYNSSYASKYTAYPDYTTSESVNDTYSITMLNSDDNERTTTRNWFNAIQHVEQNGQQGINWITFYNTTFAFNIDGAAHHKKDANGNLLYLDENEEETTEVTDTPAYDIDLDNLYWVWQIDSLVYTGFYNIRIENVRIEEVVQYASYLNKDGVKIADTKLNFAEHADNYYASTDYMGVFTSLRGRNGTGQNYQARGFVLDGDTSEANKRYMAAGNIYAPIIDARRLAVAPKGGTGTTDHKIYLDGWTVCKGGIQKYVWSADNGVTWHDMTFTGKTDSGVLSEAEKNIDHSYSGTTQKDLGEEYDHVTFTDADATNNSFSRSGDDDGWYLVADVSKYKYQSNISIIIAAVPATNTDLRCEILRIINYNTANYYISQIEEITSDIQTGSDNKNLTATLDGVNDSLNDPTAGSKSAFSLTSATCGKSGSSDDENFSIDYYPISGRGIFSHHINISQRIDYSNLQTTYSEMPVKTTLTVSGGIACVSGVYGYAYSVDGGKTWTDCTPTDMQDLPYDPADGKMTNTYEKLLYTWVQRNLDIDSWYFKDANGAFNKDTTKLKIDLSKHKGKVVDVIVAAKPYFHAEHANRNVKTDIFLPVAKIDNVAVYGEKGTFYTHINEVYLGGTVDYSEATHGEAVGGTLVEPTYFDVNGDPLNRVTSGAGMPKWNLGHSATDGKEFSYTIFEPNNANALNARLYNNKLNEIPSGGQIYIDGYTATLGSLTYKYKYTLDGGETWSELHKKGVSTKLTDDEQTYARYSDSSINQIGSNRKYSTSNTTDSRLVFNIPALPDGAIRNLLVVLEDGDGDVMPVLHIKLKIKGNNIGLFTYNNMYNILANFGCYDNAASISLPVERGSVVNPFAKFTFPVEREGIHTLSFDTDLRLKSTPATSSYSGIIRQNWVHDSTDVGTGTITMSVPKVDFVEGEDINVSYTTNVSGTLATSYSNAGVLHTSYIAIARIDDNDPNNGEVKYSENGNYAVCERKAFILSGQDGIYTGMSEKRSGIVTLNTAEPEFSFCKYTSLPAGRYRIYFINDDYGFGHSILGGTQEHLRLTAPIEITIHSASEATSSVVKGLSATVVHDKVTEYGGELYYASTDHDENNSSPDSVATWTTANAAKTSRVELFFNATAEDVKRGYIILDFDLSGLDKGVEYLLNLKNVMYSYGVRSTRQLTTDADGNASYQIKLPVAPDAVAGREYDFAFSTYTEAIDPVIHKGIDHTNDTAAGAYMSVPKTVYTVGEPIHVSYSTAGSVCGSDQDPWIGITRSIDGRDVLVGYTYVHANEVGATTIKAGMDGCEEAANMFKDLPAGNYKIYFRDCSSNIYRDDSSNSAINDNMGDDWPEYNITDPISITIINNNRSNKTPYKTTYYYDDVEYTISNVQYEESGSISLEKTVFYVGDEIKVTTSDLATAKPIWLALCEPNSSDYIVYTWPNAIADNESKPLKTTNISKGGHTNATGTYNIAPGNYQLVYLQGSSISEARKVGSVMAVIDITVLPAEAKPDIQGNSSAKLGLEYNGTTWYNDIAAYPYSRNPLTLTLTQTDIDNGYVLFDFNLTGLMKNTKIVYSAEMFKNDPIVDAPYIREGDYFYFGEYPQSLKAADVTIREDVAVDSRGYYLGSDGYYYAKVTANPCGNDYTFENGNTRVVNGEVYYFKVEPIKWRMLYGEEGNFYDILCESIIANRAYDSVSNNYLDSDVREWLNDMFYKTAFTDFQKQYIMESAVDNSAATTGYNTNTNACANTNDKIYLPSYSTVTNTAYGFLNDPNLSDPNRTKFVTDHARATGAWTNMSEWDSNTGNGIWMLRSPTENSSIFIREGYYLGEITDGGINVNSNAHGVAPMLRLRHYDGN